MLYPCEQNGEGARDRYAVSEGLPDWRIRLDGLVWWQYKPVKLPGGSRGGWSGHSNRLDRTHTDSPQATNYIGDMPWNVMVGSYATLCT